MDGVWQEKNDTAHIWTTIFQRTQMNRQSLETPSSKNYRTVFTNISDSKMHSNNPKDIVFKLLSIYVLNF